MQTALQITVAKQLHQFNDIADFKAFWKRFFDFKSILMPQKADLSPLNKIEKFPEIAIKGKTKKIWIIMEGKSIIAKITLPEPHE